MARVNKLQMINVEMEVDSISQYLWSVFCFFKLLRHFPYRCNLEVSVGREELKAVELQTLHYWFIPKPKIKWKRE